MLRRYMVTSPTEEVVIMVHHETTGYCYIGGNGRFLDLMYQLRESYFNDCEPMTKWTAANKVQVRFYCETTHFVRVIRKMESSYFILKPLDSVGRMAR